MELRKGSGPMSDRERDNKGRKEGRNEGRNEFPKAQNANSLCPLVGKHVTDISYHQKTQFCHPLHFVVLICHGAIMVKRLDSVIKSKDA